MNKWEKKFGKYAISNLTVILIGCYVVGYVLEWLAPEIMELLTLDPYAILHGQVWRVLTWIISPPSSLKDSFELILVMIMLAFYYTLGTTLEKVWGAWKYNVYIFTGILLTVAASFIYMWILNLAYPGHPQFAAEVVSFSSSLFSTYYINMSIFLAYAATFPNAEVLLMFVIPVKVKWLGIIYGGMLVLQMLEYGMKMLEYGKPGWFLGAGVAAIAASLLNFLIFWLRSRNHVHLGPKQIKRRAEFKHDIRKNPGITKHKCAICGRTDEDGTAMEFRFCSKCNGNYEYCQNHLFTHEHIK